ncbi:disintegrin and metalloproteinase domain-containing protein 10-like isoform X2 [Dysidea avara]|uniref:disintegrin and metalloproteinase domain-containing protein 10-like isoform X2 n=1 Tax=Dysidea avara TaxID=196820 RepID=UPI00331BA1DF
MFDDLKRIVSRPLAVIVLLATCYAVPLNQYILNHELLYITANHTILSENKLEARVSFRAYGRNFDLHLRSDSSLFHPNFKAVSVSLEGTRPITGFDTRQYVRGHAGVARSVAAGRLVGGQFSGIISADNDTYHVAQLKEYLSPADYPDHNTIIYLASDVSYTMGKYGHMLCSSDSTTLRSIQRLNGMNTKMFLRKKRQFNPDQNTCILHVVADHTFFNGPGNGAEVTTVEAMSFYILSANTIYRETEFSGGITNVGVSMYSVTVYTDDSPSNPLAGSYGVEELLNVFSTLDFSTVCLGHLFTYRDFKGTIGLAWVADPSGTYAGGICERRSNNPGGLKSLNTGLTSLLNFGQRLSIGVSIVTVAHEIGHNFGSPHDETAECIPSSGGNYIMYPSATDGSQPNNNKFSPCSQDIMGRTIAAKGFCFVEEPKQQECGNGIVEGDEECDCGSNDTETCRRADPCCVPGNCTLIEGAVCSPNASICCEANCTLATSDKICFFGDQCTKTQMCTGQSANCSSIEYLDGILCDNYTNVCTEGLCIGSVCPLYGVDNCMCSEVEKRCHRCCVFNETCQSLVTLSEEDPMTYNISYLAAGSTCNNYTGYCDEQHECILVDNDDVLDSIRNIFANLSLNSISEWLKNNWYIALAVVVGSRRNPSNNQQTLSHWLNQYPFYTGTDDNLLQYF